MFFFVIIMIDVMDDLSDHVISPDDPRSSNVDIFHAAEEQGKVVTY
jgi:hypothetical protein